MEKNNNQIKFGTCIFVHMERIEQECIILHNWFGKVTVYSFEFSLSQHVVGIILGFFKSISTYIMLTVRGMRYLTKKFV